MNRHPKSVGVQTSRCFIFSNAKLFDDDIKENIVEIGGVKATTFTLLMNQGDEKIVIKALFAICGIYANHDRNRNKFNSVKAVDGIIFVMNIYRIDSDIQEAAAPF